MRKDKKWLKDLINEEGIVTDMYLLGRLDEQYWKNENIKINKGRLFYLIDQLDEPQKPVIPQFVADWIEDYCDHGGTIVDMLGSLTPEFNSVSSVDNEVIQWFKKNTDKMLRALMDGYEVEKEKLYIIKFAPSIYGTPTYGSIGIQNGKKIMQSVYGSQEGIIPNQYTRREIDEVGSEYMIFAEEVTE